MFFNPLKALAQEVQPQAEQEEKVACIPDFQPRLIGNDRIGEYYVLLRVNIVVSIPPYTTYLNKG